MDNTTDASNLTEVWNRTELGYEPDFYSAEYRVIGSFINSIIFIVGVLGNFMVVAVVWQTRSMHSPTNCYLVSLALADTVVLVATVPNEVYSYHVACDEWFTGEIGCALFVFSYNLGINASSLSLVAFTVERYVAICHPMKAHTICTVSRAKKIILAVWIFTVVYSSPWLMLTTLTPLGNHTQAVKCNYRLPREEYIVIFFTDLILFYVIPLSISCMLYICIARVLFTRSLSSSKGRLKGTIHLEMTNRASARYQVVKMLAVVVLVFATLWLPYRGMLVYNSFAAILGTDPFLDAWYLMFAKSCIYINCAINPILYNAMSFKFRRAFRRALCCGIKDKGSTGGNITSTYNTSLKRLRSVNSNSNSTKTTLC